MFVSLLRSKQLAHIVTNISPTRNVIQSPDPPLSLWGLKHLQLKPERVLRHLVETSLGTLAKRVTFVNACQHNLFQSSELVSYIRVHLVLPVTPSRLDGELPATALVLVLTIIQAITTSQKLLVLVKINILLG